MIRAITFLSLLILTQSYTVSAQTFEAFPGGDYGCIHFPDGSFKLGKASPEGYSLTTKAQVEKNLEKELNQIKSRKVRLTELKREIKKEGPQDKDLKAALKAFARFFGGKPDDSPVPKSKSEQIDSINSMLARLRELEFVAKADKEAVKACKDGKKQVELPGTLRVEIVATNKGVAAVLFGSSKKYNTTNYYCGLGNDDGISVFQFRADPCSPAQFSCYRKGQVGIYIAGAGTAGTFTPDQIAYWTADVLSRTKGPYVVRLQEADKNYVLKPCSEILGKYINKN